MMGFRASLVLSLVPGIALVATTCLAGATPAQKCEAGKNKTVGSYANCLLKVQHKFVLGGESDTAARNAAIDKCEAKFEDKWQSLEDKAGSGVCPSEGDSASVQDFLDDCVAGTEDALGGGELPPKSVPMKTGQQYCYDTATNAEAACTGMLESLQDGATHYGMGHFFVDNGDGTVFDRTTGLTWEKLGDNGGAHDYNNRYTWLGAFTKQISMNFGAFGGHSDWRVPNMAELMTLLSYGNGVPWTWTQLKSSCTAGCDSTTCTCTANAGYWSSTTHQFSTSYAFLIWFGGESGGGDTDARVKTDSYAVRLVRGGR